MLSVRKQLLNTCVHVLIVEERNSLNEIWYGKSLFDIIEKYIGIATILN